MQEICRIGQNYIIRLHEILPYPLLDMCRKCEEIWKTVHVANVIFGLV